MKNKIDSVLDQALAYINIRKNSLQVSDLQKANIDINIKGGAGESLLQNAIIEAATTGDVKREKLCMALIKFLIKNNLGINVNDEDEKTSLHYAACLASPDILRLLIDKGGKFWLKKIKGRMQ